MEKEKFGERDFQQLIGNLLRYGVWISLAVAFLGGLVYLFNHGTETVNYATFIENDRSIFQVVASVFEGIATFQGESLIFLGIILLFLTPVLRVILSLFSFLLEKDYLYVGITLVVILIIGVSVWLGFAH